MPEWRTTRSGYKYPSYERDEWASELGDASTRQCNVGKCIVVTQGGERGYREHYDAVHGENAGKSYL